MEKEKEICDYLKKNHIGKERAVHSEELERLFSLSDRGVRRRISELRKKGVPICSNEKGYFYADTQKEINSSVSHLNELLLGISNARTGLMHASVLPEIRKEIRVTIVLKGA